MMFEGSDYPVTVVDWEKDGHPFQGDNRRIKYDRAKGTLELTALRLSDKGMYRCVIRTADQEELRSNIASLKIREKLKFSPRPVDRKLNVGSNTQIHCSARGDRPPRVKWMKLADMDIHGNLTRKYKHLQLADTGKARKRTGPINESSRCVNALRYAVCKVERAAIHNGTRRGHYSVQKLRNWNGFHIKIYS